MSIVKFDVDAYCNAVAQEVWYSMQDIMMAMEANVRARAQAIEMSKLDLKQKRSPEGIASGLRRYEKRIDRSMKQGGRMLGHLMTGNTKDSVVALFYEYGTGEYSQMPLGRFNHMEPNPKGRPGMIVGRPTKDGVPRGRKSKGEVYNVIAYRGGVLSHTTRGRQAGHRLKDLEVKAHYFMRDGAYETIPTLKTDVYKAIKRVNVKLYFRFNSVKVR